MAILFAIFIRVTLIHNKNILAAPLLKYYSQRLPNTRVPQPAINPIIPLKSRESFPHWFIDPGPSWMPSPYLKSEGTLGRSFERTDTVTGTLMGLLPNAMGIHSQKNKKKIRSEYCFPSWGSTISRVGKLVRKYSLLPVFCWMVELRQLLHPMKDSLSGRVPGIYSTPHTCGRVFIGQTVLERGTC